MKNKRYQINIVLNKKENDIVNALRDEYAINVSGCFKILIKDYLNQLKAKRLNLNLKTKTL